MVRPASWLARNRRSPTPGERYDLHIPLNFFLMGGAATVALSFVVIGSFVKNESDALKYPRHNLLRTRVLGALLSNTVTHGIIKLSSALVFALVISTALLGLNRPQENLSPTFIWIIWWVGTGYVVALLGKVWMLVNPWKITFELFESVMGRQEGEGVSSMYVYPEKWDVWPALLLFSFSLGWRTFIPVRLCRFSWEY